MFFVILISDRGDISAQGWRKDPVESWLSMLFQLQTLGEHALYPENNIAMVSNALRHIHGTVKRVCRKDSRDFPKILQKPLIVGKFEGFASIFLFSLRFQLICGEKNVFLL